MACFQQETFSSLGEIDGQRQYPDSAVRFDHAPYFNWNDGKVKFDTNTVDNANENYGSGSGFVPKSLIIAKGTLRGVFCFLYIMLLIGSTLPAFCQSRQSFPVSKCISYYPKIWYLS